MCQIMKQITKTWGKDQSPASQTCARRPVRRLNIIDNIREQKIYNQRDYWVRAERLVEKTSFMEDEHKEKNSEGIDRCVPPQEDHRTRNLNVDEINLFNQFVLGFGGLRISVNMMLKMRRMH